NYRRTYILHAMDEMEFVGTSLEDIRKFPAGFACCTPSPRRPERRKSRTSLWRGSDTSRCKNVRKQGKQAGNNIFLDLGFEAAEAAVLQMRAKLMSDLRAYIETECLTQVEAAERLGIAQSRVSDLVRGKWEKFNLEMLI